MVPEPVGQNRRGRVESGRTFVCPFCETTFPSQRRVCSECEGTLVVPVDESEVYETVLPMCGPDYHHDRSRVASNGGTSTGRRRLLSRLAVPELPSRFPCYQG